MTEQPSVGTRKRDVAKQMDKVLVVEVGTRDSEMADWAETAEMDLAEMAAVVLMEMYIAYKADTAATAATATSLPNS